MQRKLDPQHKEGVDDTHRETQTPVRDATSRAKRPAIEEVMEDTEKRFPKTLAHLAK
jgi:hypothetical protein